MDNKTILIADTHPSNLQFLKTCFDSAEYQVLQASNGSQALEKAIHVPDVILLNPMLPEINGVEVCQRLKCLDSTMDIPIIVMPDSPEDAVLIQCFEAGAVDYILKPFQKQTLLQRVRIRLGLTTANDRYRRIVEKASDVIYCTDAAGRINYVNPFTEQLLGFSKDEIIGRKYLEFIRPDFTVKVKTFHQHQIKEKVEKLYTEIPVMSKRRKHIWLAQQSQLLMRGDEVIGFQAISRDITQTRQLEKNLKSLANELEVTNRQLIQANDQASEMAAKAQFANIEENERLDTLRQEMKASVANLEELMSQLADTPLSDPQRQYIQSIRSACDHLTDVIHDKMGELLE
ncbi:response regulator [Desulfocicer niacini]